MEFFQQAHGWLDHRQNAHVALVTVVQTSGSVPRHVGTRMVVDAEGATCQTVGGGRVEAAVVELASQVARGTAADQVVSHHLVRDLAMCCGGSMTFLVTKLAGSDSLAEIAEQLRSRQPLELSSQVDLGLRRLPAHDGPTAPSWDGDVFHQVLWPAERAVLFGAGHVARALVPLLLATDFEVIVCDDNELGALEQVENLVDHTVPSFEPFDVERSVGPLGETDFALILTRDHAIDQRLVEKLLTNERLGYVGLIGSLGKIGRFRKRLAAKQSISESQWLRLVAPIGLDISAETPAEIAVSICAELVSKRAALRRGRS